MADDFSWRDAQQVEWDGDEGHDPGAPFAWEIDGADVSHVSRDPSDFLPRSPDDDDQDGWMNLMAAFRPMFQRMKEAAERKREQESQGEAIPIGRSARMPVSLGIVGWCARMIGCPHAGRLRRGVSGRRIKPSPGRHRP